MSSSKINSLRWLNLAGKFQKETGNTTPLQTLFDSLDVVLRYSSLHEFKSLQMTPVAKAWIATTERVQPNRVDDLVAPGIAFFHWLNEPDDLTAYTENLSNLAIKIIETHFNKKIWQIANVALGNGMVFIYVLSENDKNSARLKAIQKLFKGNEQVEISSIGPIVAL